MTKTMLPTLELNELHAARRHEAGFTLIELLIVMSVMLILMTLAVPQMLKVKKTRQRDLRHPVHAHHRLGRAQLQLRLSRQRLRLPLSALGGDPKSGAPPPRPPSSSIPAPRHRPEVRLHLRHHLLQQGHRQQPGHVTPPTRSPPSPSPSARPATTATAPTRTTPSQRPRRRHQLHPVPSSNAVHDQRAQLCCH